VSLVAAAAGLLIGTNAGLFATDDMGPQGLGGLVEDQVREVGELEATGERLAAEVEGLSAGDGAPAPGTGDAAVDIASGRAAVEGPGVTVTLDDAPVPADRGDDLPPDTYVVHQQDIEAVINTMWAAGAEAIAVQGQRLTAMSVVRCVGNVLLLGGRTYSPPYVIDAIGDSQRLAAELRTSTLTEPYRTLADLIGLTWSVKTRSSVRIDAYTGGSITLRYIASTGGQ
jgi:hypothetical protein